MRGDNNDLNEWRKRCEYSNAMMQQCCVYFEMKSLQELFVFTFSQLILRFQKLQHTDRNTRLVV